MLSSAGESSIRRAEVARLTLGFAIIYLVLDQSATWTNSLYGEYGAPICALVIVTALLVERRLFSAEWRQAFRALGFGYPDWRGLLAALVVCLALLAVFPIFALVTTYPVTLRDSWVWVAFGVLLQGGIAEELLWRGYLFRRLRAARGFWRSAAFAMLFMVMQHMLLLWSLPLPIAVAALVVALLSSFPLAHLFEAGGNTIWGAALVHAVIQGGLKVVIVPEAALLPLQLSWMAAGVIIPYLAFLAPQVIARASQPEAL